jgi:hypothetical protein
MCTGCINSLYLSAFWRYMKKYLLAGILVLGLVLAPRKISLTQANDCRGNNLSYSSCWYSDQIAANTAQIYNQSSNYYNNGYNNWNSDRQNQNYNYYSNPYPGNNANFQYPPAYQTQNYAWPITNQSSNGAWGQIRQAGQLTRNNSECLYTAQLQWTTQSVNAVQVTVLNPDNGEEKLFSGDLNGNATAPWIAPGKSYRFTLWDTSNGQKNWLSQTWVSGNGLSCGSSYNGYTGNYNYNYQNTGSNNLPYPVTGNFSLTSDSPSYCVGQTPTYTITAPPSWSNQRILWSSAQNNNYNITNSDVGVLTSGGQYGQATWSRSGDAWQPGHIGHWVKTANINGMQQMLQFDVRDCGNNLPPYTNPNNQTYGSNYSPPYNPNSYPYNPPTGYYNQNNYNSNYYR